MNSADPKQVKEMGRKVDSLRNQELNDLRFVLDSMQGRRLMWRLLSECKTFGSVFHQSGSMQSYLIGKQDFGHFLMGELLQAGDEFYLKMQSEEIERKKKDV